MTQTSFRQDIPRGYDGPVESSYREIMRINAHKLNYKPRARHDSLTLMQFWGRDT